MLGLLLCVALAAGEGAAVTSPGPTPEELRFFETSVRPVFVEHCQSCHGEKQQWAGFRVDSRTALLEGGDRGPALTPGKPAESLLIQAIMQTDPELQMPPKTKLTDRQIADLTRWVEMGAPFPEAAPIGPRPRNPDHWAFQPPQQPPFPTVQHADWATSPLDLFVLAKLEAAGLSPAAPADKLTLIRRVTFDLTGLPPTPEEVTAFLADERPTAYAELVDRLLESPAYGERWGRHWLDVARYADSNGLDENVAHGQAWRYRDYVVQAFNSDKPFDRFVTEQLAGDLLPADGEAQRHEQLIATGFLGLGAKVLAEVDETKMQMDIVDEQIDTTGKAFLALTLGCARCHDHKFDPISAADYYGLAGIFKSTRSMETFTKLAKWYENPLPSVAATAQQKQHEAQVAAAQQALTTRIQQADEQARNSLPEGPTAPEKLETLYPAATTAEIKTLRDQLAELQKNPPEMPSAMGVMDDKVHDVPIHVRGNHLKLGDVVPRHTPAVLRGPASPEFTPATSGRLQLAQWLVDPQHPLTARVMVNRIWRWHFGTGLVRTPDNFGLLGEAPTHPELLDWLAREFIAQGWSFKKMHRLILNSSTYRQSSTPAENVAAQDPENRLYARANVQRLEAEAMRDSLLAVSGQLDRSLGGSLLKVKNRGYLFDHTSKDLTEYNSVRRSLYLPVIRNNVYDLFQLYDFPDAAVPTSNRSTSTVAPQALLMLNSDIVLDSATALARKLLAEAADDAQRLSRLTWLTYGRDVTAAELAAHQIFLADIDRDLQSSVPDAAQRREQAWSVLCQVVLAANEFSYVK